MVERNQPQEIYDCIAQHGPISADDVSEQAGWNRDIVDLVIIRLLDLGKITVCGATPWDEPLYRVDVS